MFATHETLYSCWKEKITDNLITSQDILFWYYISEYYRLIDYQAIWILPLEAQFNVIIARFIIDLQAKSSSGIHSRVMLNWIPKISALRILRFNHGNGQCYVTELSCCHYTV